MLVALEQTVLLEAIENRLFAYLLLESELLDEWLLGQPEMREERTISHAVRELDYTCTQRWVWRGTEYDEHETRGPLLVQYQPGSVLTNTFADVWPPTGGAVYLTSTEPIEAVLAHLRSILFVYMPNGNKARFRLQETAALDSVLRALTPQRAATLLGPVQQLIWRENLGPEFQWWGYNQSGGGELIQGDFQFSDAEMAAIDEGLGDHQLRKQTALTQRVPHSFRDSARQQTRIWLEQLHLWGFREPHHLEAAMEVFRHPAYYVHTKAVVALLGDTDLAPGARANRALNHLMIEGT
ncbi:DUF4123 domain-containing protein [Burkholderia sp. Ac-20349]|uniref:DUF4123 domain-containing protein n=1 Tax=Burkholderia TaxID=32008 RepID=UPI00197B8E59|nr:DUF4123 domain-containing protein [Burkholderia sp. Ac-20349]MBN3838533.1 DUF4123 domain-containing protein [Burkholderia sp. Ac-20349]